MMIQIAVVMSVFKNKCFYMCCLLFAVMLTSRPMDTTRLLRRCAGRILHGMSLYDDLRDLTVRRNGVAVSVFAKLSAAEFRSLSVAVAA